MLTNKDDQWQDTSSKPIIRIEWLTDWSDCDTCGMNYAEGARVFLDEKEILALVPYSACYDGDHWDDRQVYELILEKLGYDIVKE